VLNNVLVAPPDKPVNSDYQNEDVVYGFNLYATSTGDRPRFVRDLGTNKLGDPGITLVAWDTGRREWQVAPGSPLRRAGTPLGEAGPDFFHKIRSVTAPDIGPFALD